MKRIICYYLLTINAVLTAQSIPHVHAHAHNDYEHTRPLWDALRYGFISVEADVHLVKERLLVSHGRPGKQARTLEELYLKPLDSLISTQGSVYAGFTGTFLLMIDIKTAADTTYSAIQQVVGRYPKLACSKNCPVKIFLSGNRPVESIRLQYNSIALDGRPDDLGRSFTSEQMPVVSDNFNNWSQWNGKTKLRPDDLARVRDLAQRVHAEGKLLRLWAIPDQPVAWQALLDAGVDLINTDHLEELQTFFSRN